MNLQLDLSLVDNYKNNSQRVRVITEKWLKNNIYCPNCGCPDLVEFENNKPVADFYCDHCNEQYELKSKQGETAGAKIIDGAYSSMIERIKSVDNPNFFLLNYSKTFTVSNLFIIPKHFFVPDIIEKRKPLSITAKRAGWVGCNIDLSKIPESGRINIIKNSEVVPQDVVQWKWLSTLFLKSTNLISRGWVLDILGCIDKISSEFFTLPELYLYEDSLKTKHPENNHIKDKIRQQLQFLRDKKLIEFLGNGLYRKNY